VGSWGCRSRRRDDGMEVGGVDPEWRHWLAWPGWDLIPERAKKIMQRDDDLRLRAVGASACSSS
jgi:hypothetical protein